jgi:hypothetical protein
VTVCKQLTRFPAFFTNVPKATLGRHRCVFVE